MAAGARPEKGGENGSEGVYRGRGRGPESALDDSIARMLRQLLRFSRPSVAEGRDPGKIAGPDHAAVAREAAEKAAVLLKNDGPVLPLDPAGIKTLAVIGELAAKDNLGDHGSSIVTPPHTITILDGLKAQAGAGARVVFDKGSSPARAAKAAAKADAVIVVAGLSYQDEGEGHDRTGLELADGQVKMIAAAAAANPRTAVVLVGGSAMVMDPWIESVPAVLLAWYPGMEGGNAIANIIFGGVNPSGKLPLAFPRSEDQLPAFENKSLRVEYQGFHGYRYLDSIGAKPLFPFGFGLSYTSFLYANLRVERTGSGITARVDVTNTGARPGEEVAQFYAGYEGSRVARAARDLKGFARVALAPGETKTAEAAVAEADLAFYDAERGAWEAEDIGYRIYAGPSSDPDRLLAVNFRLR